MPPLTSVITLTHNKCEVTRKCLSTLPATDNTSWELIVVDNGSTDGTREWLQSFKHDVAAPQKIPVTIIQNDANIGCCTARNQGIEAARGKRIAFIDNDIAVRSTSWLNTLGDVLDREEHAGIVGPKLVYPFPPYNIQCAGVGISPNGRVLFRGRGKPADDPRFNRLETVQCLISACCMTTTDVLAETGGFDEAFNPVEFEDFDLVYRMRGAGYEAYYTPDVEMYHFESVTTAGTPSLPNTRLIIKNGLLFKKRWQHLFAEEEGPRDEACKWRDIPTPPFAEIGDLPTT